ncbi:hypothetical protein Tco_1201551 [Tanacetum coccineum]
MIISSYIDMFMSLTLMKNEAVNSALLTQDSKDVVETLDCNNNIRTVDPHLILGTIRHPQGIPMHHTVVLHSMDNQVMLVYKPPRYEAYKEEKKSSKYGMGTGLAVGAAAGLLGGLAIAEGVDYVEDHIADDAADKVEDDLGYDVDDDY